MELRQTEDQPDRYTIICTTVEEKLAVLGACRERIASRLLKGFEPGEFEVAVNRIFKKGHLFHVNKNSISYIHGLLVEFSEQTPFAVAQILDRQTSFNNDEFLLRHRLGQRAATVAMELTSLVEIEQMTSQPNIT